MGGRDWEKGIRRKGLGGRGIEEGIWRKGLGGKDWEEGIGKVIERGRKYRKLI